MLHRGFGIVQLSNGNKLLLIGRPSECWLVVDSQNNLLGEFNPKTYGAGSQHLGSTSIAKLSNEGICDSLVMAIVEKMVLDDNTVYLDSRAGKKVP